MGNHLAIRTMGKHINSNYKAIVTIEAIILPEVILLPCSRYFLTHDYSHYCDFSEQAPPFTKVSRESTLE